MFKILIYLIFYNKVICQNFKKFRTLPCHSVNIVQDQFINEYLFINNGLIRDCSFIFEGQFGKQLDIKVRQLDESSNAITQPGSNSCNDGDVKLYNYKTNGDVALIRQLCDFYTEASMLTDGNMAIITSSTPSSFSIQVKSFNEPTPRLLTDIIGLEPPLNQQNLWSFYSNEPLEYFSNNIIPSFDLRQNRDNFNFKCDGINCRSISNNIFKPSRPFIINLINDVESYPYSGSPSPIIDLTTEHSIANFSNVPLENNTEYTINIFQSPSNKSSELENDNESLENEKEQPIFHINSETHKKSNKTTITTHTSAGVAVFSHQKNTEPKTKDIDPVVWEKVRKRYHTKNIKRSI